MAPHGGRYADERPGWAGASKLARGKQPRQLGSAPAWHSPAWPAPPWSAPPLTGASSVPPSGRLLTHSYVGTPSTGVRGREHDHGGHHRTWRSAGVVLDVSDDDVAPS